jgi:hypothetical protein
MRFPQGSMPIVTAAALSSAIQLVVLWRGGDQSAMSPF